MSLLLASKTTGSGLKIAKPKECSRNVFRELRVKARVTNLQKYLKQVFFVVT